jgi:signal transduction histidine kinase
VGWGLASWTAGSPRPDDAGVARAARVGTVLLVALGAGGIVVAALVQTLAQTWDAGDVVWLLLAVIPPYALAVFVVRHRPDHPQARWLLVNGVGGSVSVGIEVVAEVIYRQPRPGAWLVVTLYGGLSVVSIIAASRIIALHPDGVAEHPALRGVLRGTWALVAVPVLLLLASPTVQVDPYLPIPGPVPSPFAVGVLAPLAPLLQALFNLSLALPLAAVGVLLWRYRSAAPERRTLMRSLLRAVLLGVVGYAGVIALALTGAPQPLLTAGYGVVSVGAMLLIQVTIALGVLRHRLFDIDVVVTRSTVYGVLWVAIALGYAALAAAPGIALGGRLPVEVAVLLTIVVAMAFQPMRRRVEVLADRLVHGRRFPGYQVLRAFGEELDRSIDVGDLLPRLAAQVRTGLGASWVRVSLQLADGAGNGGSIPSQGTAGTASGPPVITEQLRRGDELLGMIECGPRDGSYAPQDRELLAALARQAATAVSNVVLAARLGEQVRELARSRMRIVAAQDAERRRIERNIHDGAQQEVVALIAKLRLARNRLDRGEDPAGLLAELQDEARELLADLRELAHGIHPPVLSDNGLVAAVEARAGRLPLEVAVRSDDRLREERLDEDVEGAAYFVVCEALTNVVKHAGARHVDVGLARIDGHLTIDVRDDGRGLHAGPAGRGMGLLGVRDRVEALGGRVHLDDDPDGGARLHAELPVASGAGRG